MAGTLFENNLSPYLTIVEQGSTPASPGAGDQKLFIRTSDHLLCYVNSSGTVTPVSAGGSGSITASGYTQNTARLLGRTTASAGAIEEITVGSGLSLSAGSLTASGSGAFPQTSIVSLTTGDLTTTSTSFTDATGLTTTITTGAHRCLIYFSGNVNNTGSNTTAVTLLIDGTNQGQTFGLAFIDSLPSNGAGAVGFSFLSGVLSAGSHTFKIQWRVSAGTGKLWASTTVTPAILTVIETSQTT